MTNFAFVATALPPLREDCARAEAYLHQDPRSACIYARRAAENLVGYLYDLWDLPLPYVDDLAARMNDAAFKQKAGTSIAMKLNALRKVGNAAVHDSRPVQKQTALMALRELFHVMVWAAFHHSTAPETTPTGTQFDPAKAPQQAPLSTAELNKILAKFKEADDALAKARAEREELKAAHEAEIAELRAQIAAVQAAQAAQGAVDDHDYSEAETRGLLIDLLLAEAGWPLDQPRDREFEVTGMPRADGSTGIGRVDYVLWGNDGLPLAVVEAKRTTRSPLEGQQQAKLYADCLEATYGRRPVIFYTNGYTHRIWDDADGYPPREVQGFYTRDELELLIQRRTTRLPLASVSVDSDIAGRHYQQRAISAVDEVFTARQRAALLVMATGSGKTRTTIALVDQLMRAGWVKRVLFLADRTALVKQAGDAFKKHLPDATTVNLLNERDIEGRVYVSTYPTMMNLIDDLDGSQRRFGPGYFDLVVIDEAHRSVYQKYGAIFTWFDSLLVGLTATPKDEVDHNTYRLFDLEDGVPTDAYTLDEAVTEGYLVPPRAVSVGTRFLEQGITYAELSEEEKEEWENADWGEDGPPDAVDSEALNRYLFNIDTVDQVLATLMTQGYKVEGGDRIAKTIIFAKNQEHANFIYERFCAQYPELGGDYARVITHGTSYVETVLENFKTPTKEPSIAISVDMLDTGIDVPEVANLVFFKKVRSKAKFWQMIGRGTRLCPDLYGPGADKKDFFVFDFCGNLEYFATDPAGTQGSLQKSLNQRLFEMRLALARALESTGTSPELQAATLEDLRAYVEGMNLDNFIVRPHRQLVETYTSPGAWRGLSHEAATAIVENLAGLPSANADGSDEHSKRFDVLVLRHQLAQLEGHGATTERIRTQIQEIAAGLLEKLTIPVIKAEEARLRELVENEWWVDVTVAMLESMRTRIRGLVQFLDRTQRTVVYTDFADELSDAVEITLPGTTPGADMERFRAKAAAYLREHEDDITLQKLRRNKELTPTDLETLERILLESGAGDETQIAAAAESAAGLGLFVRSLVGLDRQAAMEAFAAYLDESTFNANQLRFINLIIDELTRNGVMEPARLFESPYTDTAPTGPDYFFPDNQVAEIVTTLRQIKTNAAPTGAA